MASRRALNLLDFNLAFSRCPEAKKSDLVKLWRNHFTLYEKMNSLLDTDKKIDFDSYESKIDNKEYFKELKSTYEKTNVPYPSLKLDTTKVEKFVKDTLSNIDKIGKKLNPNEARYINLMRVPGSRQHRIDLLVKGWQEWPEVRIAYYGFKSDRKTENSIRMTYPEYVKKCEQEAEKKNQEKIKKALERKEMIEKFKSRLFS